MKTFDAAEVYTQIIDWIRNWFADKGPDSKAVLGMSGGKDSTITAKLLADALGPKRVIGVAMPDEGQGLNDADKICKYLGINYIMYPINIITDAINNTNVICKDVPPMLVRSIQNIPPRIRMAVLYMIGQSVNGYVIGTCNVCEDFVGYFTRWGDGASDMCPLAEFTVEEVKALGKYMNLPMEWVDKTPDDGLPFSQPDEQKLGVTYKAIGDYIRGNATSEEDANKIAELHENSKFKLQPIPCFPLNLH